MMVDPDASLATLEALKSLGLQLAIDDFGTGYSSLSYLQRFPIDVLKIDGTFAAGATGQQEESALIAAIVHLADSLGLTAVAEGIETAEQARALAAMGCDWAQGHHFARAQPAAPTFEALRRAIGPDLAPLRGAPAPR
jgi:EAL domain-containing protein (putative c-di-GMP-specific phosphodiesterase class I)